MILMKKTLKKIYSDDYCNEDSDERNSNEKFK